MLRNPSVLDIIDDRSSGVPECGARLSEMIASIVLLFSIWHSTNEGKAHRIQGSDMLANLYDFIHTIVWTYKAPVIKSSIFQYARNDVGGERIHLELFLVHIPKADGREFLLTFLATHLSWMKTFSSFLAAKIGKSFCLNEGLENIFEMEGCLCVFFTFHLSKIQLPQT